jgi:rRNA biogenesis protein RRP5
MVIFKFHQASSFDSTSLPHRIEDFEKLVVSNPNSSFMWIQYMSHYLRSGDVIGAREIANRAIKTISFREEGVSKRQSDFLTF